ncbi:TPA: type IV secretion protein Dot [Legionella pneumophila subsp. pneumophila]|uniref:Dot/Icm secretion system substrate n=1 Tax=Legionella pneumophila TaxID=446 RepID=A0A378K870_LEGPN|nr:lpg1273 family Dot/Icm T4SS effector [Legionella pneumophila]MCK1857470.1 type IV secretion protein Dot [Legionella pneumophila]MCW8402164.1 type IV secretion protein Dot [Legionella pneumophila]MCW8434216.1 type IV secretion protein Dot [Legionella pneumophila]MCW8457168.1 type IV secretion protein Dot [Legionella pneumophila]MCW8467182.1 type IV secretion protein Dot [Legionella pneumophila]
MKIFKGLKKNTGFRKQSNTQKISNSSIQLSITSLSGDASQPRFDFFPINNRDVLLKSPSFNHVGSEFQPMVSKRDVNSISITLPIKHNVHRNHDGNLPGDSISVVDSSNQQDHISYLQLCFTHEEGKWYLFLKCLTTLDVFNYDFAPLLKILHKPDIRTYPMSLGCPGVIDRTELVNMDRTIYVRQFIIHGPDDEAKILQDIHDFNMNCLRRFEELTYGRDNSAYRNSQALGRILHKIITAYQEVTVNEYDIALNRLKIVFQDQVFQNDPQICLSLTHIVNALIVLSQKKELNNKGVEIDEHQLHLILKELAKHEGKKFKNNLWFPIGTVDAIRQELEELFISKQTISTAPIMS